jgi:hypothetical protein
LISVIAISFQKEALLMGAKRDLNHIYGFACFGISAIVGLASQSLGAFVIALVVLLGICLETGKIRS